MPRCPVWSAPPLLVAPERCEAVPVESETHEGRLEHFSKEIHDKVKKKKTENKYYKMTSTNIKKFHIWEQNENWFSKASSNHSDPLEKENMKQWLTFPWVSDLTKLLHNRTNESSRRLQKNPEQHLTLCTPWLKDSGSVEKLKL